MTYSIHDRPPLAVMLGTAPKTRAMHGMVTLEIHRLDKRITHLNDVVASSPKDFAREMADEQRERIANRFNRLLHTPRMGGYQKPSKKKARK